MNIPEIYQNQRIELKNIKNDFLRSNKPFSMEHFFENKSNNKTNLELHTRQEDFEKIRNQKIDEKNTNDKKTEQDQINNLNQEDYLERKINNQKIDEKKRREQQHKEEALENSKIENSVLENEYESIYHSKNNLSEFHKTYEKDETDSTPSINAEIENQLKKQNILTEDLKKIERINHFYKLKDQAYRENHQKEKKIEEVNKQESKNNDAQDNKILSKSKIIESLTASNEQKKHNLEQYYEDKLEVKSTSNNKEEIPVNPETKENQLLEVFLEKKPQFVNDEKHQEQQIINAQKKSEIDPYKILLEKGRIITYGYDSIQDKMHKLDMRRQPFSDKAEIDLNSISYKSIRKKGLQNRVRNSDKAVSALPNETSSNSNHNKQLGTYDANQNIMKAERNLVSPPTTSSSLLEDTRSFLNTEPEKLSSEKPMAPDKSFKDRTAYHWDSKKGFLSPNFYENSTFPNPLNNNKGGDFKTIDREIYANNDDEKKETSNFQSNNNSSNESSSSFNQSSGWDQFNQNSSVISQNESAITLVENKIAPEVLKQIERIRKMGKSWIRISIEDHQGIPLNLHMQVRGNVIQVRFGTNSEGIRGAIEASWDNISTKAEQIGIQLKSPEFINNLSI